MDKKLSSEFHSNSRCTLPPLSLHSPSTLPPLSLHSPSTLPPLSLHSPSTLPPLSLHSRSTLAPLSLHSPSTLPPLSLHSPSTLAPLSLYSRSTIAALLPHTLLPNAFVKSTGAFYHGNDIIDALPARLWHLIFHLLLERPCSATPPHSAGGRYYCRARSTAQQAEVNRRGTAGGATAGTDRNAPRGAENGAARVVPGGADGGNGADNLRGTADGAAGGAGSNAPRGAENRAAVPVFVNPGVSPCWLHARNARTFGSSWPLLCCALASKRLLNHVVSFSSLRSLTLKHVDPRGISLKALAAISPQLHEFSFSEPWKLEEEGGEDCKGPVLLALEFPRARRLSFRFLTHELKLKLALSHDSLTNFSACAQSLTLACRSARPLALTQLLLFGEERIHIASFEVASVRAIYLNGPINLLPPRPTRIPADIRKAMEICGDSFVYLPPSPPFAWADWLRALAPTVELLIARHDMDLEACRFPWPRLRSLGIVVASDYDVMNPVRGEMAVEDVERANGNEIIEWTRAQRRKEKEEWRETESRMRSRRLTRFHAGPFGNQLVGVGADDYGDADDADGDDHADGESDGDDYDSADEVYGTDEESSDEENSDDEGSGEDRSDPFGGSVERATPSCRPTSTSIRLCIPPSINAPNLRAIFFPTRRHTPTALLARLKTRYPCLALYCVARNTWYWERKGMRVEHGPLAHVRGPRGGKSSASFRNGRKTVRDKMHSVNRGLMEGYTLDEEEWFMVFGFETCRSSIDRQDLTGGPVSMRQHASVVLLIFFLKCADGFAGEVTGGHSGPFFWVTTLSDSGPGSLREGATIHGSRWILFNVSGTICLSSPVGVASNKTIDGRGQRVVISCNGLHIRFQAFFFSFKSPFKLQSTRRSVTLEWSFLSRHGAQNIIINNLIFWRGGEDAIQLKYGAQRVWINHVSIGRWGDGAIDVTRGSTDVTISRSLFHHHNKVMLVGSQTDAEESKDHPVNLHVSIHTNWFAGTVQRHPRVVAGLVHVYNNVFQHWGLYGVGSTCHAQIAMERNIFLAGRSFSGARIFDRLDWPSNFGRTRSVGDLLIDAAHLHEYDPDHVFNPPDFYNYTAAEATLDLMVNVASNAGWHDVRLSSETGKRC
ncbi:unnamed protein product [Closterium sp. Yama58-4]|nr:unnamed protein product [Closterium sp. Yama58-4]